MKILTQWYVIRCFDAQGKSFLHGVELLGYVPLSYEAGPFKTIDEMNNWLNSPLTRGKYADEMQA